MADLRVGMRGLNADRGWAREAHAPAVLATYGLNLRTVATRRQDSADAEAARFNVPKSYAAAAAMINDPDIDVVSVISSVPTHREYILEALHAGIHVLTDWPVTVGSVTTAELAATASKTDSSRE
jgi:predicted dehydrogenase